MAGATARPPTWKYTLKTVKNASNTSAYELRCDPVGARPTFVFPYLATTICEMNETTAPLLNVFFASSSLEEFSINRTISGASREDCARLLKDVISHADRALDPVNRRYVVQAELPAVANIREMARFFEAVVGCEQQ